MRISVASKIAAGICGLFFALILLSALWERHVLPSLLSLLGADVQHFSCEDSVFL